MSDDLNTEIKIGADASGVEAGVGRAKRSLATLGDAANKAGKDGGKGIELLGVGGDKAAKKVESATRSMQSSIQRLIAEQKAGEKGSRAYYEALADSKGINRNALKPLLDQLDEAKRKTNEAKNAADDWRASLGKINGAAVGAAIAAAAVGISALVKKTIDSADAFSKLSAKSGVAVDSLRELNYAASLSDVSTDSLGNGLRKLSQNMAAAAGGSKLQADAFKAAGVEIRNLDGSLKGADEMLKELASRFAGFKDGPEKAALAMELFGKQGADLIPLLNGGAAGLAEMAKEANDLGIVFDGDLAKSAEEFNDNLTRIQTSAEGAAVAITRELLPTLNKLAQAFVDSQNNSQSFAGSLGGGLRTALEATVILVTDVAFTLKTLGREIGGIVAQIEQYVRAGGVVGIAYDVLAKGRSVELDAMKNIRQELISDAKQARADLDKFHFQLLNARFLTSKAGAGRGTAPDPRALGVGEGTVAPIVKQGDAATKPVKEALSEYDKLVQKLSVDLPKAAAAAEAAQNGYNKSQTAFLELAGSPAWAKFTNSQRANVAALFETAIASEQASDAAKALAKANEAAAAAREKYITSLDAGLDKIQADIAAQIESTARMGLSKTAIADLDAAKLEMLATDTELQAVHALDRNLDEQTYAALKKQAAAYRELAKAKQQGAAKEVALDLEKANADAAKKAEDDWQKTADSINQSLTDALLRGFESGKDFAKNMRDTIVNMFKTMVLRPVISAVLSPVSAALMGGVGLAGSASAGQSGSSLSTIASGASLLGNSAFGMGLSGAWGAGGGLMSTLGAGTSLLGTGTLASISSGIGVIAGALGPIALGVALLGSLIKPKTYHSGGAGSYSAEGGATTGLGVLDQGLTFGVGASHYDKGAETAAVQIAKSISGMLDATAQSFGQGAGYYAATAFADDTSKDGAWGSLIIRRLDETILNWADTQTSKWAPKEFSDGDAGKAEYLAALAQGVRGALDAMDLPGWASDMLAALGDAPTLEGLAQTVDTINAASAALDKMGQNLSGFAALSDSAVSALVKASGGMDGLIANASAYYDAFYSDAEKSANVLRDVGDTLAAVGLSAPKTKDELRAMVEANQALGEAGMPAVAAIFSVAGAFSEVTDAADAAAAALKSSVQGGIDSLAKSLGDMHKGVADADAQVAAARMSIWSGYNAAQTELIDLEKQSAEATRGFARSLREYVAGLSTGPNSSRGLESNYLALQRQFSSTAGKAGAGDQDARDSLTTIADQYLEASRARSRTSVEYARDSARVAVALGNLATKAEGDPLVQKYDAESLTIQQQIADAQIDVVKYLALMEATGTSTDLGIQTVDGTLQGLRDAYVSAEQAQAAANLKLDVALAALDALGLTEQLVNVLAGGQTNSLSAALNISDEALASITGALGLTPENVADLATEFGVEVALLVGNAATELADTLAGALAFDPSAFDALKTVVGYDTESPDFAALRTILGFDLESGKFQALQTILGFAPEAVAQIDGLAGAVGFAPDAAARADALAAGIAFAATATEQINRIAAGVSLTDIAAGQVDALAAGIGWADGAQVDGLLSGVGWGDGVDAQVASLIGGLHLTDAASAQVQGLLDGLSLAPADRLTITSLLEGIGFTPATQTAVETGIGLQPGVMDSLGSALGLTAEARNAVSVLSTFGSIESTVKNAYAQIGRSGIGTAANQIDQGGFDYWKGQLASGAVQQQDFLQTFLASAAQGTRENPDSIYADYVSQYLKKLGIPGFAVGTSYVPSDMLAMLHKGEAVVPAAYNPAAGNSGGDNREVVAELRALRAELATHKAELASIRTSSSTTATGMTGIVNKQVTLVTEAA